MASLFFFPFEIIANSPVDQNSPSTIFNFLGLGLLEINQVGNV